MPGSDRAERKAYADADRLARTQERANAKVAREQARAAKAEARAVSRRNDLAQAEREAALARSGYKRSFLTGRVVPVRGSRRARAHTREV